MKSSALLIKAARVSLAAPQAILDLMAGRRPQFVLNPSALDSKTLRATIRD